MARHVRISRNISGQNEKNSLAIAKLGLDCLVAEFDGLIFFCKLDELGVKRGKSLGQWKTNGSELLQVVGLRDKSIDSSNLRGRSDDVRTGVHKNWIVI